MNFSVKPVFIDITHNVRFNTTFVNNRFYMKIKNYYLMFTLDVPSLVS